MFQQVWSFFSSIIELIKGFFTNFGDLFKGINKDQGSDGEKQQAKLNAKGFAVE